MATGIETVAHIAAVIGVAASLVFFALERRQARRASEFDAFMRLLDLSHRVAQERRDRWRRIREALRANPKTAQEVHDRQDSVSYLALRAQQEEPFFVIEHELLEGEIRSLNFLNELARLARSNDHCRVVLAASEASEISYYRNHKEEMLGLYEREKAHRKFTKPRSEHLHTVDASDWFDD